MAIETTTRLSGPAADIYDNVLAAMQDAEEAHGTDGAADYIALMERISAEALKRAQTCRVNNDLATD